jgi:DNA-binding NarL/FixJ family response regulator
MNADPLPAGPVSVWLIEDNMAFRNTVKRVLNQLEGLECERVFASCEEALEALRTESVPDVILLDFGLPGMNGIEGIQAIKAISPNTHVIMLTVFDDHDKIFRAICAGASGYLLKSSPEEKIAESIREVLQGGAPMNARIARSVLEMFAKFGAPRKDYGLTARESQILELMTKGYIKKQIADELSLSYHTVDTHLRNIYSKLQVHTRTGAVAKALQERLF